MRTNFGALRRPNFGALNRTNFGALRRFWHNFWAEPRLYWMTWHSWNDLDVFTENWHILLNPVCYNAIPFSA